MVGPEGMALPLLWVVLRDADNVNGFRFDANLWDPSSRPTRSRTPRWPSCLLRNAPAAGMTIADRGHSSGKPIRRRPTFSVFSRSAQC